MALDGMSGVEYWPDWETRSRSSGGFDVEPRGIVIHDNACPASQSKASYCHSAWATHPERPVGNITLARDLAVVMGCAGASNCAGKGGPWTTSRGVIPKDKGNQYTINIECQNNGVDEPWAPELIDRYIELLARLCRHYGLNPLTDIAAHHEWAITDGRGTILGSRGRPSRKIDVSGPQSRYPYINSSRSWDYDALRADVAAWAGSSQPPTTNPQEDDDVQAILMRHASTNQFYVTDRRSYAHKVTVDEAVNGRDTLGWEVAPDTGPWPASPIESDFLERVASGG